MASRRQQRSFALNHIPPLPFPHGLEYPLGPRMHLGVVHPRLEARGRRLPHSPRSRSRVNLRVLRPLTRRPQGQPSPLRTPHRRPGVQGIFSTSRVQAPHGWPMVHYSMATGFRIARGCCLALSAFCPGCVSSATPQCPVFFYLIPSPALSPRPAVSRSLGVVVRPLTHCFSGPAPSSHPSCCFYTPPGRQQPSGAGPQDPHPSGDNFVLIERVVPIPSPCPALMVLLLTNVESAPWGYRSFENILMANPFGEAAERILINEWTLETHDLATLPAQDEEPTGALNYLLTCNFEGVSAISKICHVIQPLSHEVELHARGVKVDGSALTAQVEALGQFLNEDKNN